MSYCLNPNCPEPKNPPKVKNCQACGSKLLLRDRYLPGKKLGKGGFGATFLAADLGLPGNPLCVIKQLRPSISDPSVLKMARDLFDREANTLGKIGNHPQVPRLLDYFEDSEQFYLVQEFVNGYNLQQEIKLNGPFDEPKVRFFLNEILPVLQYIHSQKVIHRDIKPANIIRREIDGKLVLIDFGAVKNEIDTLASANPAGQTALTAFSIGTLGFAPPEQLAMRPVYSSDIYAVGVTSIYLLTGKSPKDLGVNAATGELEWESTVFISESLAKVLRKMLELSVRNRYKSAQEAIEALEIEPFEESFLQNLAIKQPTRIISNLPTTDVFNQQEAKAPPTNNATSKLAGEIRAYNERKRQKSKRVSPEDITEVGSPNSSHTDKTVMQTDGRLKNLKLPSKINEQVILEFYEQGWRDFAQRSLNQLDLRRANLASANFHQSQLSKVNFMGTNLTNVDLGRTNLFQAVLKNANLTKAYLGYSNLEGADLRGADLTGAHLNHANLKGANLCGANLTSASITEEQIAQAKTNWATILPNGKRNIW